MANNNTTKKSSKKNDMMSTSNMCCMILMVILIIVLVKSIRDEKKRNRNNNNNEGFYKYVNSNVTPPDPTGENRHGFSQVKGDQQTQLTGGQLTTADKLGGRYEKSETGSAAAGTQDYDAGSIVGIRRGTGFDYLPTKPQ